MKLYKIILPNERAKVYGYVTLFILVMNIFVFGVVYLDALDARLKNLALWGGIISLLSAMVRLVKRFTKYNYLFRLEMVFLILAIVWFFLDKEILALVLIWFRNHGHIHWEKI